jgi:hypothetical protein
MPDLKGLCFIPLHVFMAYVSALIPDNGSSLLDLIPSDFAHFVISAMNVVLLSLSAIALFILLI